MSNANQLELEMLALVNAERATAGLAPLQLITALNDAAETHSNWMLDTDSFSHTGAVGSAPSDRMTDAGYPFQGRTVALENIGWQSVRGSAGFSDDVAQIHTGLMASDGHRANILSPEVTDIGIGIETGQFDSATGSFDAVMVTQVFAKTDADVSALVDPGTGAPSTPDNVVDDTAPGGDQPAAPNSVPVDAPPNLVPSGDEAPTPVDTPTAPDTETPIASDTPRPATPAAEETNGPATDVVPPEMVENQPTDDLVDEIYMPPDMADLGLPSGFGTITVDLSSAFEFRREGDQMIWETSEEKLVETFLASLEDWAGVDKMNDADIIDLTPEDVPDDMAEIMMAEVPLLPFDKLPDDPEYEDEMMPEFCA